MVLDPKQIDAIFRLSHGEKWSVRKISRHLNLSRKTVKKYLLSPLPAKTCRKQRASKLDPYRQIIRELLDEDPKASTAVIAQRIQPLGYTGKRTILDDYIRSIRRRLHPPRAYIRVESNPGDRFEIDWGHFGWIDYKGDKRRLYAFCCVECHSRRLYLEFTHSQKLGTLIRCHLHAFRFMKGSPRECLYDNMRTVVSERDGRIIRFNPRFLAFAHEFGVFPRVCNPAAGWEKGKVERGGIRYVRQNFWPLRSFSDLADVNRQARQWLDEVANQRLHSETRERPDDRFRPDCLRPLPVLDPDYRDKVEARVHKDIRLRYDGNRYCVSPRLVGCWLKLKADSYSVTIYEQDDEIVRYPRCWQRGQTLGAARFEKELLEHRASAQRSHAQRRLTLLLGEEGEAYLRGLAETDRVLSRQIRELLDLVRQYGPKAVEAAISQARRVGAYGSDYIANILLQEQSPRQVQPRLKLKDPRLNELATDPLSLLDYDALILKQRRDS